MGGFHPSSGPCPGQEWTGWCERACPANPPALVAGVSRMLTLDDVDPGPGQLLVPLAAGSAIEGVEDLFQGQGLPVGRFELMAS